MKKLILKIKSHIYRYTGVYLAYKEEAEFLTSDEFWDQFGKDLKYAEKNSFNLQTVQGIILGMWQSKNNFVRVCNPFSLKTGIFNAVLSFFYGFYLTLEWDIQTLKAYLKTKLKKLNIPSKSSKKREKLLIESLKKALSKEKKSAKLKNKKKTVKRKRTKK